MVIDRRAGNKHMGNSRMNGRTAGNEMRELKSGLLNKTNKSAM